MKLHVCHLAAENLSDVLIKPCIICKWKYSSVHHIFGHRSLNLIVVALFGRLSLMCIKS